MFISAKSREAMKGYSQDRQFYIQRLVKKYVNNITIINIIKDTIGQLATVIGDDS